MAPPRNRSGSNSGVSTSDGPRKCPRCGHGILFAIADDDDGTTLRCFACEWQGTQPKRPPEVRRDDRRPESATSISGGVRSPILTNVPASATER